MQLAWPTRPHEEVNKNTISTSTSIRKETEIPRRTARQDVLEKDIRYVMSRPTLQQMLGPYPLLYDLCQRMLDYDPLRRITAAEALQHPFFTTPICSE
ncbi:hypothetical protein LSM04_000302 [Trypanosoma melophagium]|nr:hypothetical protein LSM04_000302 [Trypanosoma melophagium]